MINPKLLSIAGAAMSALKTLIIAIIGGAVVAGVQRCNTPEPVQVIITNPQHEKEISDIRAQQDTLSRSLPTPTAAQRYLQQRYHKDK